jgi:hypothetical protein
MTKSIINGLIILHDNNFKNIHLSKEAIVISSENTYKMIDNQLCNRIHPYFEILNGVPPKSGTYIAPEQLAVRTVLVRMPGKELLNIIILPKQSSLLSLCSCWNWQRSGVWINSMTMRRRRLMSMG